MVDPQEFEYRWNGKKENAIENIPFEFDLCFDDALLYEAMCEAFYDSLDSLEDFRDLAVSIKDESVDYEVTGWESSEKYVTACISDYMGDQNCSHLVEFINFEKILDALCFNEDVIETDCAVIRRKNMHSNLEAFKED